MKELKNLWITIDLTNISDIYAISVLEEKTGEERKKFLDFFVDMKKKTYQRNKFYDDFFEKVTWKNRQDFQQELQKPKRQSKKGFWLPVLFWALVWLFWDL